MNYKKLAKDADIDVEVAVLQSAVAIDAAGIMSEQQGNIDGMISVAAMWLKISETISDMVTLSNQEIIKNEKSRFEVGFQAEGEVNDGD